MFKEILAVIMLIAFYVNSFALELKINANVETKFTTTVNVTKVSVFNENVGAVEMVFDMQQQLYLPMDSLPEPVTGLSIDVIKIYAPSLTGNEDITASIRMAYRRSLQDTAVPLYSANHWSASSLKNGAALVGETGLNGFNNTLLADITNANVPRVFSKILFVIKIRLDGSDASTINLDDLNLQLQLTAKVITKAPVIEDDGN